MKNQFQTKQIASLNEKIDFNLLHKELNILKTFPAFTGYSEYKVGLWQNYTLRNSNGKAEDGRYYDYEGLSKATELSVKMPYISGIIENTFNLEFLKLARIFEMCSGGFLLPHKDGLDGSKNFNNHFLKLHIPLQTSDGCFNSYEEKVYHMKTGEIWLHHGHDCVHSAANFSSISRLHLVLDFVSGVNAEELFKDKSVMISSKPPNSIDREPITEEDIDSIYNLSKIINEYNFKDIVAILGKIHFRRQISSALTYDWLHKIAEATNNKKLVEKSNQVRKFLIGPRDTNTLSLQWY
ncbi:aspartyl/asparaginyl beta-hydroxylase domain-containing protein [Anabaena sp. FACHB-1237]|uniref:aspartyl/asparaginyl beta-hydroxylase domain-containing protein n=1 Tax=Anabaena sp. FACHB-1237 TaxID=2692769 RepID=UPI0016811A3D|nr:aspartyl/asparaginyl beta-hydroxylase domain-containing protein [Anabaena sp. FACHB-1237]MBD2139724.1 aspartyl/asparaginyl beta-hydroxylase domain-containing protein [Anabaena sp. FACHB-1237]